MHLNFDALGGRPPLKREPPLLTSSQRGTPFNPQTPLTPPKVLKDFGAAKPVPAKPPDSLKDSGGGGGVGADRGGGETPKVIKSAEF